MLSRLSIKNFALIEDVDIQFQSGLTVITGETGAGKSILLGALSLVLGNRAERNFFQDLEKKCIIEAWFQIDQYKLKPFFDQHELDYEAETIIRREVNVSGKSRVFINDTPCRLDLVQDLGAKLIDIHSQNQSHEINEDQFKYELMDSMAGIQELKREYQSQYVELSRLKRECDALNEKQLESQKREDYLQFQIEELHQLQLKKGEETALDEEYQKLSNGEELLRHANHFSHLLEESETNLFAGLREAKEHLESLVRLNPQFSHLSPRMESSYIELKDIQEEISQFAENFEADAKRLAYLEERLGEIHRLKRKHGLDHSDDLIALQENLNSELFEISGFDEKLKRLEEEIESKTSSCLALALEMRSKRIAEAPVVERSIVKNLNKLEIPDAQFKIEILQAPGLNAHGLDQLDFLFSANQGHEPKLLAKTASGGEVSRLMLSLKAEMAKHLKMPTVLFDEIDTGISGETAKKMAEVLAQLGQSRQVIAITHLPQIASRGKQHLFVYKSNEDHRTRSNIKALDSEARIIEIAKMLSGNQISEAARNNALDLINNN